MVAVINQTGFEYSWVSLSLSLSLLFERGAKGGKFRGEKKREREGQCGFKTDGCRGYRVRRANGGWSRGGQCDGLITGQSNARRGRNAKCTRFVIRNVYIYISNTLSPPGPGGVVEEGRM